MEQKLSQPFLKNSLGLKVLAKAINLDLSYINKNYFYPAIYHSDAYSMKDSIPVGFIDEVVAEDKFMERVMEKAVELSSLPHPFYIKTKHFAQGDVLEKIADAIKKYEKLTAR